MYLGIKAVFAQSFARIHRSNLINFGIIPINIDDETYAAVESGSRVVLENIIAAIDGNAALKARDALTGKILGCTITLSQREKDILQQGGLLNYIKTKVRG